jgi:hypothetical protein
VEKFSAEINVLAVSNQQRFLKPPKNRKEKLMKRYDANGRGIEGNAGCLDRCLSNLGVEQSFFATGILSVSPRAIQGFRRIRKNFWRTLKGFMEKNLNGINLFTGLIYR